MDSFPAAVLTEIKRNRGPCRPLSLTRLDTWNISVPIEDDRHPRHFVVAPYHPVTEIREVARRPGTT